jgi:hypothetical protein
MTYSRPVQFWSHLRCILFLAFSIALMESAVYAQTPTIFSGKWKFDKTKSDPGKDAYFSKEETDVLDIVQDADSITINKSVFHSGVFVITISDGYRLDGKEKITINNSKPIKETATWSRDKKSLTITKKVSEDNAEYRLNDTYSLSKDGKLLSIRSVFEHPHAGSKRTLVYVRQ